MTLSTNSPHAISDFQQFYVTSEVDADLRKFNEIFLCRVKRHFLTLICFIVQRPMLCAEWKDSKQFARSSRDNEKTKNLPFALLFGELKLPEPFKASTTRPNWHAPSCKVFYYLTAQITYSISRQMSFFCYQQCFDFSKRKNV